MAVRKTAVAAGAMPKQVPKADGGGDTAAKGGGGGSGETNDVTNAVDEGDEEIETAGPGDGGEYEEWDGDDEDDEDGDDGGKSGDDEDDDDGTTDADDEVDDWPVEDDTNGSDADPDPDLQPAVAAPDPNERTVTKSSPLNLTGEPKSENLARFLRWWNNRKQWELDRLIIYVYRLHPVLDHVPVMPVQAGKKPSHYIDVFNPGHAPIKTELEWLNRFGGGDYQIYANDKVSGVRCSHCICSGFPGSRDYNTHPPQVNMRDLAIKDPANEGYLRWLDMRGIKVPGHNSGTDDEDEDMASTNAQLLTHAMDKAEAAYDKLLAEHNRPRQSNGTDSAVLKEYMTMIREQNMEERRMASEHQKRMFENLPQGVNGLEIARTMAEMSKLMSPPQDNTLMQYMMARSDAAEQRSMQLIERLINPPVPPPAQDGGKPTDAIDKLEELARIKGLLSDLGLANDGAPPRESMWEKFMPVIIQTGLTLMTAIMTRGQTGGANPALQQQAQALQASLAGMANDMPQAGANGGFPITPMQPPDVTPQEAAARAASAGQGQGRPQANGVPGMDPQVNMLLNMIADPMTRFMNSPNHDGVDFAEWFIKTYGRGVYDQIIGMGHEAVGQVIAQHPATQPLVIERQQEIAEFMGQFLSYDQLKDEDGDGNGSGARASGEPSAPAAPTPTPIKPG